MAKKTPLYDKHVVMGGKLVDFAGWEMPINYGSQIEEHHQVRNDVGMFDVSHMSVLDLRGVRTRDFLRALLANDIDRLREAGKALYTCMLNEQGGILDDLIVYYMEPHWFRLVLNAATHDKVLAWIERHARAFSVEVNEPEGLAMIAVQGPNAQERLSSVLDEPLSSSLENLAAFTAIMEDDVFVSRTGYTGEDGFEIILPGDKANGLWRALYGAGVRPIGLAARDTLRLEAGMSLYGSDMDESTTPLEVGLEWTVAWEPEDRDFVGRAALEQQRQQSDRRKLVGLVLNEKGILRDHQKVFVDGFEDGEISSGSYSPTLGKSIAFASVPSQIGSSCKVDIRGKLVTAMVIKPPFVRRGKSCIAV